MISIPTVLILGAGASAPYGFPLGIGLRNKIVENLSQNFPNGPFIKQLLESGFSTAEIENFRDAFFYSGKASIDAFLENRSDYLDLGKAAIAQELMKYESKGLLFDTTKPNLYFYIYQHLNALGDNFSKNTLSILTYNYDRSFEEFLFTALMNSYNLSDDAAAALVNSIPIVHLHGHLGELPWATSVGNTYGGEITAKRIVRASKSIKIIHETLDDDPEFNKARVILDNATKVVFLGFGYDKTNLKRLRLDFTTGPKEFSGSCMGLSELEKSQLHMDCARNILLGSTTDDALKFLRECVQLQ